MDISAEYALARVIHDTVLMEDWDRRRKFARVLDLPKPPMPNEWWEEDSDTKEHYLMHAREYLEQIEKSLGEHPDPEYAKGS